MPAVPATIPNPTPDFPAAQRALAAFLDATAKASRVVALHDFDADGVAAGVIWQRALERLGYASVQRVLPDRERSAWTPENQARVAAATPETLFVLDLGSQAVPVLSGVRTCFIDHHRPEGIPPGDTLISAYSWQPIPTTSLLVYDLFNGLTDVTDLNWIAAIGALSDLGDKAPFQLVADAKKQYTAKYLKEATTLVNAVRRASTYNPEAAAQALLMHASPRDLVESSSPEVQALKDPREEVKVALKKPRKPRPSSPARLR